MLMKYSYLLLLLLSSVVCYSQTIDGDYFGKFWKSSNLEEDDNVKLSLKSNNSFTFSYKDPKICTAVTHVNRFCSGTYIIKEDTLILKSKYSINDFTVLTESRQKNYVSDSCLIILKPSKEMYLYGNEIHITIDSVYAGSFQIGDTVRVSNVAANVKLSSKCLYDMDWVIHLKKREKPMIYSLRLILSKNKENLGFDDERFIIHQNKILMLKNFYFLNITDNIFAT